MKKFLETAAFLFALAFIVSVLLDGCKSFPSSEKEVEAEGRFGALQYTNCIKPEPLLGADAPRELRIAAWDRVDKCRAAETAKWDAKDAGGDR